MNNPTENFEPTGYQDDENGGTLGRTGLNEDPTPPQKKKSIIFPLVIGGIGVVGLAAAYFMFLKPQPRPQQAPQQQQQAQQNTEEPATATASPASDPFGDANAAPATTPVADPAAAPALDPLTGLPAQEPAAPVAPTTAGVDPVTGLPAQLPVIGAPAAAPGASGVDPITGLPAQTPTAAPGLPTAGVPAGLAGGTAPTDPLAAAAPAGQLDAPVAAPAATPEVVNPVATPVSNDPLAQFKDMLAPIDGRVTTLEGKVDKLESSVDGLSKKVDALGAKRPATVQRAPAKKRVVREQPRSNSIKVEQSYRVSPPVSRVIIDDGRVAPRSDVVNIERPQQSETIRAGAPTCTIQAITAGRAWTRRSDGSFVSYAEGDTWVNGQQIETIDPQKGIRAGGRWICM